MPAAKNAATLRFVERSRGGDSAEDVKQSGVGRDLEIEVKETVDEDADATKKGGDGESAGGLFRPIAQLAGSAANEQNQEPDGDARSDYAGFDQQLKIVVVGLIDKEG